MSTKRFFKGLLCGVLILLVGAGTGWLFRVSLSWNEPAMMPLSSLPAEQRQFYRANEEKIFSDFALRFVAVGMISTLFGILGFRGDTRLFSAAGAWKIAGLGGFFLVANLLLGMLGTFLMPFVAGCLCIWVLVCVLKSRRSEGDLLIGPIALYLIFLSASFAEVIWKVYGD